MISNWTYNTEVVNLEHLANTKHAIASSSLLRNRSLIELYNHMPVARKVSRLLTMEYLYLLAIFFQTERFAYSIRIQ